MKSIKFNIFSLSFILNLILLWNILFLIGLYYNAYSLNKIIVKEKNNFEIALKKEIIINKLKIKKFEKKENLTVEDCNKIFLLNEIIPINLKSNSFLQAKLENINNDIKNLKTKCLKKNKINFIRLKIKNKQLKNLKEILKEKENWKQQIKIKKNNNLNTKNNFEKENILKNNKIFWVENKKNFFYHKYELPIQKKNSNTCVIDNLWMLIQNKFWLKINKKEIYKKIWKQNWDYWHTWYFIINETGWHFIEKEWFNDFKILEQKSKIKTETSSSIDDLKYFLYKKEIVLMEVPMEIIYPKIKKFKNSNIFHAITIFSLNSEKNQIEYYNSLNWKFEKLDFEKIKLNEKYLKYPFRKIVWF